jgi:hypothetical protein
VSVDTDVTPTRDEENIFEEILQLGIMSWHVKRSSLFQFAKFLHVYMIPQYVMTLYLFTMLLSTMKSDYYSCSPFIMIKVSCNKLIDS